MTYWHTTFGVVSVEEAVLEKGGRTVRPFLQASGVTPRSYSTPLHRRVVDFGADVPFHDVPNKFIEHYGIELCTEVIRKITLKHAEKIKSFMSSNDTLPDKPGVAQLIAEADGGMIPIVEFDESGKKTDKRKTRTVSWKEARLCFCRDVDKIEASFRATLKSVETVGDLWFATALVAGMGTKTKIHSLGDGAKWIKDQADRVFGGEGSYLIDFYHTSEYLGAVAKDYTKEPKKWLKEQQARLKGGQLYLVLQKLEEYLYGGPEPPKESVKACYRYLTNRLDQLDYLGAIMDSLPIGSGEIESAHRHVVQKRMKRAGSWWKEENAESMLQLLTLRANRLWDGYWSKFQQESTREVA